MLYKKTTEVKYATQLSCLHICIAESSSHVLVIVSYRLSC